MIVWVNSDVVLNRTFVDSDWRFDNLCGSHLCGSHLVILLTLPARSSFITTWLGSTQRGCPLIAAAWASGNSVSVRTQSFFYFLSMKPKLKFSANGSPGIMLFTASLNSEQVSVTGKPFTLAVLYEDFLFPPTILISVVKRWRASFRTCPSMF